MTARASPTARWTRSRQRSPRSRTPAPATPAGRCARSASSATRGFEHAFLRPPKQSSRRRGLVRTHSRLLARAPHRRRSIPPADPRGRGLGKAGARLAPGNPGAMTALFATGHDLRVKSRDLVRRNAWAGSAVDAFVTNCIGTGIKPQSIATDAAFREAVHALWWDWCDGGRRRRRHRLLRPPGARLPGHAGGRRVFRAAQGAPARGRSRGAAAAPAARGRACAAHLQHDIAERQPGAGRHRVRPAGTKGRLPPDPRPSRRSGDAAPRPRPGAGAGRPHRPSLSGRSVPARSGASPGSPGRWSSSTSSTNTTTRRWSRPRSRRCLPGSSSRPTPRTPSWAGTSRTRTVSSRPASSPAPCSG